MISVSNAKGEHASRAENPQGISAHRSDIVVQRCTTSNKTEKTKNKQPEDEPSIYSNLSSLRKNKNKLLARRLCLFDMNKNKEI